MGLMSINFADVGPLPARDLVAEVDYWARQVAACALMEELSFRFGVSVDLVWRVLCMVPDNMLSLLDSPQGWTTLSAFVAGELGICPPDYAPAVH
jgi:hypothetical protein